MERWKLEWPLDQIPVFHKNQQHYRDTNIFFHESMITNICSLTECCSATERRQTQVWESRPLQTAKESYCLKLHNSPIHSQHHMLSANHTCNYKLCQITMTLLQFCFYCKNDEEPEKISKFFYGERGGGYYYESKLSFAKLSLFLVKRH